MTEVSERTTPVPALSMAGLVAMFYATTCYLIFIATIAYFIGFLADALFLPRTIDRGQAAPPAMALLIDVALLGSFAIQHSVMARPSFKRAWVRIVPKVAERSTYMLAASLCLGLLMWQWRPLDQLVWSVTTPGAAYPLWTLQGIGWGMQFVSTCLINHFELFGLSQAANFMTGRVPPSPRFQTPLFYRYVRHPLYLGFIIAFWAAPHLSLGHLVFAVGGTGYILAAICFEERDLVAELGQRYRDYQMSVPMLLPFRKRR